MPLTPQDVHSKVFGPTRFRRGYDETEVDAFLDEVEAELRRLHGEIDALRGRVGPDGATDTAPPAPSEAQEAFPSTTDVPTGASLQKTETPKVDEPVDLEQRVARTLVLAQRAADEALQDAETQAEQLRRAAQAEVDRMRAEADEAASRERSAFEQERHTAQDDVEQLRAFEREYRTRLRAYLELQLRELDGSGPAQVEDRPSAPALAADSDGGRSTGGSPDEGLGGNTAPSTGPQHADAADTATAVPDPTEPATGSANGQLRAGAVAAAPDYATGGVSGRAVGDEQGHEPPRHGL